MHCVATIFFWKTILHTRTTPELSFRHTLAHRAGWYRICDFTHSIVKKKASITIPPSR